MASSSGKRIKTLGSKRKEKEPDRFYSNKFLSRKHERYFNVVQDRRLLMERKAGLIPQFGEQLENRNMGRLATYPAPANIVVVKEFYTNARRLGDHPAEDYLSYVRGHAIRYDPDSINRGISINIGQVIANEIQVCANTMNNKAPLGHPSLITHLCELAGFFNCYQEPYEAEPFQMRDMYMSLMDARMQSLHRGQVATTEMIIGMYDTLQGHRWTIDEFNNVVAWLEEQTQGSGVGAARASTMDDDEDAFEDVEDDEEEEDSDDSMG
ncbi:hypothetical protein LR48_Vigan07g154100 [Vigna angularis]|uniref:Putative plant transposon protein domain-containing protein n=1 Tax=Phaseolus angularis TaxID=3914 RepID=A0A0L9UZ18_PHAAN|nr:hypothetical protein LR48_Vigan07g154100 [Vigna angularis]